MEACCISHMFSEAATAAGNRAAIIHATSENDYVNNDKNPRNRGFPPIYPGDEVYTFAELLRAVNSLASRIVNILSGGHDPDLIVPDGFSSTVIRNAKNRTVSETVIGVYIDPSAEYIVAILAVLRSGAVFLPVDPSLPRERILTILSDSHVPLVVSCCHASGKDSLEWTMERRELSILFLASGYIKGIEMYECNFLWPCQSTDQRSYCYVMYTSGSTGKPKGACGTEKGLLNRLHWMESAYPSHAHDIYCFKTAISFIDHLAEILGPLLFMKILVIPSNKVLKENFFELMKILKAYNITRLTATPTLLQALLPLISSSKASTFQKSLRVLVLSGETFTINLWKQLHEIFKDATILNLYGTTEVSGDCAYFDCKNLPMLLELRALRSVPIGKAIPGCEIILVREGDLFELSDTQGEIWVGGKCCADKYLNDLPGKSSKFVKLYKASGGYSMKSTPKGETILFFKTGDLAMKVDDGNYVFLGRNDRVVKIHGQRVSLDEIECTLKSHPLIEDAAVSVSQDNGQLQAYIVLQDLHKNVRYDDELEENQRVFLRKQFPKSLRNWFKERLPEAMIPSSFSVIKSVPLLASGKTDYTALSHCPPLILEHERHVSRDGKASAYIDTVKQVFSTVLNVAMVENEQDFFSLGGNSIAAAHAAHKLGIAMHLIYQYPSAQKLHDAMQQIPKSLDGNISNKLAGDIFVRPSKNEECSALLDGKRSVSHFPESSKSTSAIEESTSYDSSYKEELIVLTKSKTANHNPDVLKHTNKSQKSSHRPELHYRIKNKREREDFVSGVPVLEAAAFTRCNKIITCKETDLLLNEKSCLILGDNFLGSLEEIWKVSLHACVDASPLVVKERANSYLFIGSHAHKFMCIDLNSGSVKWESELGGRVESTATITDDFSQVVVGSYDGAIYFLDCHTGSVVWCFQTSAEVKSQPVVDMSRGWIWCGSHDHHIYALDPRNKVCVFKHDCGGSIFGAPAYDKDRSKVYVATTSGRISSFDIMDSFVTLSWLHECKSPIFGSPAIESSSGYVICSMVKGDVIALSSVGSCIWQVSIGGPVFAGPCISLCLPLQVVINSRDGFVYALDVRDGHCLWRFPLGEPITSSAYVDEHTTFHGPNNDKSETPYRLLCVCGSSGTVSVLKVNSDATKRIYVSDQNNLMHEICPAGRTSLGKYAENQCIEQRFVQEYAKVRLAGDIFSSPVMIGGEIFLGCRDNHLYCIKINKC